MYAVLQSAGFDPAQAALSAVGASILSGLVLFWAKRVPPRQNLMDLSH